MKNEIIHCIFIYSCKDCKYANNTIYTRVCYAKMMVCIINMLKHAQDLHVNNYNLYTTDAY